MPDAIDDLFRRFGKAFNKADVDEIAACVTDDFEWRLNAGGSPAGRVLKGKEALRASALESVRKVIRDEGGKPEGLEDVLFTSFVMQ